MTDINTKKKLLDMWFKKIHSQINLLESRVRHFDLQQTEKNDYNGLIDTLDTQFENIKIIRKILKNDAFLRGFNHELIK